MSSSSRSPAQRPSEEHGLYYLGKVGQKTQMTRAHCSPQQPPMLPAPTPLTEERRQLPPLPQLQPPLRSHNPQPQFLASSLPERPHQSYTNPPPLARALVPQNVGTSQAPNQRLPSGPVSSLPHPHLYAQKASFQSRNPGTVYEALSPVEFGTGGPASLFNEAAYNQNPYASGAIHNQSPPISQHSSTASSSGAGSGRGSANRSSGMPRPPGSARAAPREM